MPPTESIFLPDDEPPRQTVSRVRWIIWLILLLAVAVPVGLEIVGSHYQSATADRLRALCQDRKQRPWPTLAEVETRVGGWPLRSETPYRKNRSVVFTWPSVFRGHLVRVIVADDNRVVQIDLPWSKDGDVTDPIAMDAPDGLEVVAQARTEAQIEADKTPLTGRQLQEAVRGAFAGPRENLRNAVLIFPVVDEENRIRPEGAGLSTIAGYSAVCSPRKRLEADPRRLRDVLAAADCWRGGTLLDQARIDLCTRTAGTAEYVVPRLKATDEGLHLTVDIRGPQANRHQSREHQLGRDELPKVPGLIALDVLVYLGVELPAADRDWVLSPQIQNEADAVDLTDWIANEFNQVFVPRHLAGILDRNPACVAGWDVRIRADSLLPGIKQLAEPQRTAVFECSAIQRTRALALNSDERHQQAILELLKLAPTERGEPYWYAALIDSAMQAHDDELVSNLFAFWEQNANDYPNRLARGSELLAWGGQARSRTDANYQISPQNLAIFHERVRRAQHEYERALEINPLGWGAHRDLLVVARSLGLPFEFLQRHFLSATRLCPSDARVYRNKLTYLWKMFFGTRERLFEFGRECLASEQWEAGIPQFIPEVLYESVTDRSNRATEYRYFKAPEHWELLKAYFDAGQRQPDKDVQRSTLNYFASQAVLSGHFVEAAEAFDRLDAEQVQPQLPIDVGHSPPRVITEYDPKYFPNGAFQYSYWRDIALAEARPTTSGRLSAVRIALAGARLDDAERLLGSPLPADEDESAELERCRRALALGRRLMTAGKIELTPHEALEVFAEFKRKSCRGLDRANWWKVDGTKLTWNYPAYDQANGWIDSTAIFFPVGVRHAVISATVEAAGIPRFEIVAHSQAPRNLVFLNYDVNGSKVALGRLGESIFSAPLSKGPWEFVLQYQGEKDRLSPIPATTWDPIVVDDVPSTFGFVVHISGARQSFSISELKIELRN